MRQLVWTGMLALLVACESSSFSDNGEKKTVGNPAPSDSTSTPSTSTPAPDTSEPAASGGGIFDGSPTTGLPSDCKDQSVLILDFKSGWWEGDGGDTFRNQILDEIQLHACTGSNAGVEYHHIIQPFIPAQFYDRDFATYTQVWILSGSLADEADIPLTAPGFLDLLQQITAKKPRLFLGAGFGSVDHANEVAKRVWGSDAFYSDYKTGEILTVEPEGANVLVKTHITPKVTGNIFQGVSGPLVDHVEVGGVYAGTDEVVKGLAGMTMLAECTTPPVVPGGPFGQSRTVPSRTVGCIAVGKSNGFNVILDAGLQRFYGLYRGEEPTKVYLRNILRALSL